MELWKCKRKMFSSFVPTEGRGWRCLWNGSAEILWGHSGGRDEHQSTEQESGWNPFQLHQQIPGMFNFFFLEIVPDCFCHWAWKPQWGKSTTEEIQVIINTDHSTWWELWFLHGKEHESHGKPEADGNNLSSPNPSAVCGTALHPRDRRPPWQTLPAGDERSPREDFGEVQHHHDQRQGGASGQWEGRSFPDSLHGAGGHGGESAGWVQLPGKMGKKWKWCKIQL